MGNSQGIADLLAQYGRNGDNRLVHMNDAELRGLASLSPTGSLPINPVTGQPEAFSLKKILPVVAAMGATALMPAGAPLWQSALASGMASGVATGALENDLQRGIMAGVMGAGISGAMGSAAANTAANVDLVGSDMAASAASMTAGQTVPAGSFGERLAMPFQPGSGLMSEMAQREHLLPMAIGAGKLAEYDQQDAWDAESEKLQGDQEKKKQAVRDRIRRMHMMAQPGIFGMAAGGIADIKKMKEGGGSSTAVDEEDERYGYAGPYKTMTEKEAWLIQQGLRGAHSVAPTDRLYRPGFDPEFDYFQDDLTNIQNPVKTPSWELYGNMYRPFKRLPPQEGSYFNSLVPPNGSRADGLITGADRIDAAKAAEKAANEAAGYVQLPDGSWVYDASDASVSYGGTDSFNNLGPYKGPATGGTDDGIYNAPDDTRTTLPDEVAAHPEWWFDRGNGVWTYIGPRNPDGTRPADSGGTPPKNTSTATTVMAAGGDVQLNTSMGPAQIAGGGIANVPTEFTAPAPQQQTRNQPPPMTPPPPVMAQAEPGGQPSDQDIQMLAMALTGQAGENADRIIEMFVQKFGPDMFREAREFILKTLQPGAQTEGIVQGPGGGMDDQVMGTIGGQQPVAVSPGEYIVPADVVSGIGDGSSDAGAAELDRMAKDIRMARGGRTTQPPAINARQLMPR